MVSTNPGDKNLTDRFSAAVDGIDAAPDLAGVLAGADRRRRRSRSIALGGAAAVVALGVGGVVMVSNRDAGELPVAQPDPVVVPLTTLPPGAEVLDAEPLSTEAVEGQVPVTTIGLDGRQQSGTNAPDPADDFLEQTEEVYRREMPSGYDLQIRRSNDSYGELFGIAWDLPTGSQAECLGGPAVFIGAPAGERQGLSSWTVQQWWPIGDEQDFQVTEHYGDGASRVIIRTELAGVSAGIVQRDETVDVAEFVDGVVAIELPAVGERVFDDDPEPILSLATEAADGTVKVETLALYSAQDGNRSIPDACMGPPFPGNSLPAPGAEQPADPAGAEVAVRDRHAILVDRSDAEKPADILTDNAGVAEARAEMAAGQFGESAAVAEYTIDDVVFTDAETAWFEYTIVAPTGTFSDRFGQAIFNGEVWQITRQTICQDLSLAGGQCEGADWGGNLRPPFPDGLNEETAFHAWQQKYQAYSERLSCNPLNACGDFDLSQRLPDPGEQPDDAAAERVEIIELMESLYGGGALLAQLDRIDDPTGIAETVEKLGEGAFSDEVDSASVTVDELVFMSPEFAMFVYTLNTNGYIFTDRPGIAAKIDGVWKIARQTVCDDLALGGFGCDG